MTATNLSRRAAKDSPTVAPSAAWLLPRLSPFLQSALCRMKAEYCTRPSHAAVEVRDGIRGLAATPESMERQYRSRSDTDTRGSARLREDSTPIPTLSIRGQPHQAASSTERRWMPSASL